LSAWPFKLSVFGVLLWVSCLAACGGGSANASGSRFGGQVVARAEGFASRPEWADPDQPLRQNGSALSFVGSVVIGGEQSLQIGYRASDSYARAELLRFLRTRVVSVLFDRESSAPERRRLEEVLDQSADAVISDWSIEAHYWEKVSQDGKTKLLVFSRMDVDASTLADLFARVTQNDPNLLPVSKKVREKFSLLAAEAKSWSEAGPTAPGITAPAWARSGDGEDGAGFTFVCQGTADDEGKALSLATARCNEKLCRLFGVKLSSRLSVREDLNGIEAKNETSESCDVRVQGRKTLNKAGECGAAGCTFWLRQSYPRASFDEEKARIDQPTIVRQEVVIQEGDKHYRDPAACEQNLRNYGRVEGHSAESFRARKALLGKAIGTCEGIDGRDSGLFVTLNTLLVQPLEQFALAVPDSPESIGKIADRFAFTLAPKSWRSAIDTDRFLTERIAKVRKLVDGAILPWTLFELGERGGTPAQVEEAMAQVMRVPFTNRPATIHHRYYVHDLALSIGFRGRAPVSPSYRRFLLDIVARNASLSCGRKRNVPGENLITYFAYDGTLDDEEWQAALKLAQAGDPSESAICMGPMLKVPAGSSRPARLAQIGEKIASGAWPARDQFKLFRDFLGDVQPEERLALFLRYEGRLTGKPEAKTDLVQEVVRSAFGWDWDYLNGKPEERAAGLRVCGEMPSRIGSFFRDHPDAKPSDTGLCLCLRLETLSPAQRRGLVKELDRYNQRCGDIRPEDRPEGSKSVEQP
jgi:hypothetical protein